MVCPYLHSTVTERGERENKREIERERERERERDREREREREEEREMCIPANMCGLRSMPMILASGKLS